MKVILARRNMFLALINNCVYYTFNTNEATDFSNMEVEEFADCKKELEKREMCEFEIKFVGS